jgi:hypothetical protein
MSFEAVQLLTSLGIPYPDATYARSRSELLAIRRKLDGFDLVAGSHKVHRLLP